MSGVRIMVRVVEIDGAHQRTEHAYREHVINEGHTVRQAVEQEYAPFEREGGACQALVRYRDTADGVNVLCMWDPSAEGRMWFAARAGYISAGDRLDIEVRVLQPGGPKAKWAGRPEKGDVAGVPYHRPPGGPGEQGASMVSDWLRQLKRV